MVFTRDLRVTDNPALAAAAAGSAHVVPLFVFDDALLARFGGHASRLGFLLESLRDLDASLRARGGALVTRRGDWVAEVIETARAAAAGTIHLAADVSGYAARRVARLRRAAAGAGLTVHLHPGITVVAPGAIAPPGADAYQVFTPYYRRWLAAPRRPRGPSSGLLRLPDRLARGALPRLADLATAAPRRQVSIRGGESAGRAALRGWAGDHLAAYETGHDDLGAGDVPAVPVPALRLPVPGRRRGPSRRPARRRTVRAADRLA